MSKFQRLRLLFEHSTTLPQPFYLAEPILNFRVFHLLNCVILLQVEILLLKY